MERNTFLVLVGLVAVIGVVSLIFVFTHNNFGALTNNLQNNAYGNGDSGNDVSVPSSGSSGTGKVTDEGNQPGTISGSGSGGGGGGGGSGGGGGTGGATDGTAIDDSNNEGRGAYLFEDETTTDNNYCSNTNVSICTEESEGVCGWFDSSKVSCTEGPCVLGYINECDACLDSRVLYWTYGECPFH